MSFADVLGMGVSVHLLDMFSGPSRGIEHAARSLTGAVVGSQNAIHSSLKTMAGGGALMFLSGGVLGLLAKLGVGASRQSSELDIYNRQLRVLAVNQGYAAAAGDALYKSVTQFAVTTPFTVPEVQAGAKNLMVYRYGLDNVMTGLKHAGNWAAFMNEKIEKTTEIIGRINTGGYGRALTYIRGHGISDKDIHDAARAQGTLTKLFDSAMRARRGYSGALMTAAFTAAIEKNYKGKMDEMMQTIPGMVSNIKDTMVLALGKIGDVLNTKVLPFTAGLMKFLQTPAWEQFAIGVGHGLTTLLNIFAALFSPLLKVMGYVVQMSEKHPAIAKWIVVTVGLASALLFLSGAVMVMIGAKRLWLALQVTAAMKAFSASVIGAIWPLALTALAVGVLYLVWTRNFGGMRDSLTSWFDKVSLVFGAVTEILAAIQNGVAYISLETYNALEAKGLTGLAVGLSMIFYRIYQVVAGAYQGVVWFGTGLAWLLGVVWQVLWPVRWLVSEVLNLAAAMGIATGHTDVGGWKAFGVVIGFVASMWALNVFWTKLSATWHVISAAWTLFHTKVLFGLHLANLNAAFSGGLLNGVMAIGNGIVAAARAAWGFLAVKMGLVTAAQWAFNTAAWANPIGLVILVAVVAIGLLVYGVYLLIKHWDTVTAKVTAFAKAVWSVVGPIATAMWAAFSKVLTYIKEKSLEIWGVIGPYVMKVWEGIVWAAKKVGEFIQWAWSYIKPAALTTIKWILIAIGVVLAVAIVAPLLLVGLILIGVAAVLAGIVWVISKIVQAIKAVVEWAYNFGVALEDARQALVDMAVKYSPWNLMIAGWTRFKVFFMDMLTAIKDWWKDTMWSLVDNFWSMIALMLRISIRVAKLMPEKLLPESVRAIRQMNPDALDGEMASALVQTGLGAKGKLTKQQLDLLVPPGKNAPAGQAQEAAQIFRDGVDGMKMLMSKPTPIQNNLYLDGRQIHSSLYTYGRELAADGNFRY